jgi:hypothetical protein
VQGVIGYYGYLHRNVSIYAGLRDETGGAGVFLCCRFMFSDEVVKVEMWLCI